MQQTRLSISKILPNTGQIDGLPKNPRFIRDERFFALVKSIKDDPEMLELRELIVFPIGDEKYVIICGNMRFRAVKKIGEKFIPCKILPENTPVEKLRAYAIKDNIAFGSDDMDSLANEWDDAELTDFGMELPNRTISSVFENDEDFDAEKLKYPITFFGTKEDYQKWCEIKEQIGIDDDTKAIFHVLKNDILT